MKTGEYRAAMRGESWKFALMNAIDDALLYSADKESFIEKLNRLYLTGQILVEQEK